MNRTIIHVLLLVAVALLAVLLLPPLGSGHMTPARIVVTKTEEAAMAEVLKYLLATSQSPLPSNAQAVHRAILSYTGPTPPSVKPHWTNSVGEALDMWGTPYRVEIAQQTNFVIHSAGKNQSFGDKDDIVYDSSKTRLSKP